MRYLAILLAFACSLAPAAERPPNLIFVLADDLGYGELGCYGSKLIATPHLDRMAAEGLKFTKFYAGSTVCAPSRSVLMTGLHTGHTRVRGNAGKQNKTPQNLRREDVTLPETLKQAGYATALIGKWGIGHEGSEGLPNLQGFDYHYGYLDQGHAHNPYPEFIVRNGSHVPLRNRTIRGSGGNSESDGAGVAEEPIDYVPDLMAQEALQWIEQQKERPFFLYWALITPHGNNEGNKLGRGQEVPELGEYETRDWPLGEKRHAAAISRLDRDMGRLFERLKSLRLDDKTLVVFSSDNGPHREGGNNPAFFQSSGPFRGIKRDLTDGGIRVPFIARWPRRIAAGAEEKSAFWFADVLPAFAALAGAKDLPKNLDGTSTLGAILMGAKVERTVRPVLYWEFHEGGFSQAVLMDERWKAIRLKRRDAPIAIYDTEADPNESKDLSGERKDLVDRARALFTSERSESPDWPIRDAVPGGKSRK